MKKETLEEAAERYDSDRDSFIAGAKYMAERMYSEEDLRKAFHVGRLYQGREGDTNFEKWFEQLKQNKMETKLTGQELHAQPRVVYEIDFEKVNTLEDVKDLLKALRLKFFQSENTEEIKHLLKELK